MMKKGIKVLALSLCFVFCFATLGLAAPVSGNADVTKRVYTRDAAVQNVEGIEFITGDYSGAFKPGTTEKYLYKSRNHQALEGADVGGTDLGIPFYNSNDGKMYILFGDTYGHGRTTDGEDVSRNWRSSVMAISDDFDLSDGLTFNDWYGSNSGTVPAKSLIKGKHIAKNECIEYGYERTKIPQGGIEVNGTVYVFYESIRFFGEAGFWTVNYQGAIKSTDNCKTWERVHDLTWFADVTDDSKFDYAVYSAAEDCADAGDLTYKDGRFPSKAEIDAAYEKIDNAKDREAPYFSQAYPVDGKDGYVYLFGRKAGRQNGIKVARVAYANIEDFDSYEYFCGNENNDPNKPIWKKGTEGLEAINNDTVGYVLASGKNEPASNMSVMYNEYLGKWMLFYYRPAVEAEGNGVQYYTDMIGFRLSDTIWGNYGEFHKLIERDFFQPDGEDSNFMFDDTAGATGDIYTWKGGFRFYGGGCHEMYQEENGKIFYFIATIGGIYNSFVCKVTLN